MLAAASQTQLEGVASVQLFSALRGLGLEDARTVLKRWCTEGNKGPRWLGHRGSKLGTGLDAPG